MANRKPKWWEEVNRIIEEQNQGREVESVSYTGAGEDGRVQPDMPVKMEQTTQGPAMIHEGEMEIRNRDGSVNIIPQKELKGIEDRLNMRGFRSGGFFNSVSSSSYNQRMNEMTKPPDQFDGAVAAASKMNQPAPVQVNPIASKTVSTIPQQTLQPNDMMDGKADGVVQGQPAAQPTLDLSEDIQALRDVDTSGITQSTENLRGIADSIASGEALQTGYQQASALRPENEYEQYITPAIENLKNIAEGKGPYFEQLANLVSRYDASTAQQTMAHAQRMASNPYLSDGAKRVAGAELMRSFGSEKSKIIGNISMQIQEKAIAAAEAFGKLAMDATEFKEGQFKTDLTASMNRIDNIVKAEVAAGNMTVQEATLELEKRNNIINAQLEDQRLKLDVKKSLTDDEFKKTQIDVMKQDMKNAQSDIANEQANTWFTNPSNFMRDGQKIPADEIMKNPYAMTYYGNKFEQDTGRKFDPTNQVDMDMFEAYYNQIKTPTQQLRQDVQGEYWFQNMPPKDQDYFMNEVLPDLKEIEIFGGTWETEDGLYGLYDPSTNSWTMRKGKDGKWTTDLGDGDNDGVGNIKTGSEAGIENINPNDGVPKTVQEKASEVALDLIANGAKNVNDTYIEWYMTQNPNKNMDELTNDEYEKFVSGKGDFDNIYDFFNGKGGKLTSYDEGLLKQISDIKNKPSNEWTTEEKFIISKSPDVNIASKDEYTIKDYDMFGDNQTLDVSNSWDSGFIKGVGKVHARSSASSAYSDVYFSKTGGNNRSATANLSDDTKTAINNMAGKYIQVDGKWYQIDSSTPITENYHLGGSFDLSWYDGATSMNTGIYADVINVIDVANDKPKKIVFPFKVESADSSNFSSAGGNYDSLDTLNTIRVI